jgi:predicted histidine transporter YuiF (NhaC family)
MCNEIVKATVCVLNSIDSATAAAWIQAFGSIAALIVAVYISYRQHKKQTEREDQAAKQAVFNKYSLAISLGGGVAQKIQNLESWSKSANPNIHAINLNLLYSEIKGMHGDLIKIDLNNMDSFETINIISQLKTFSTISLDCVGDIYMRSSNSLNWSQTATQELQKFLPQFIVFMGKAVDYEKAMRKNFNIHKAT